MLGATVLAPMTLAAYQDGAVMSRILLKPGGGSVTLFALDEANPVKSEDGPYGHGGRKAERFRVDLFFCPGYRFLEGQYEMVIRLSTDVTPGAAQV
jgi:hypothetical protein